MMDKGFSSAMGFSWRIVRFIFFGVVERIFSWGKDEWIMKRISWKTEREIKGCKKNKGG
jgi:hypothetical protein